MENFDVTYPGALLGGLLSFFSPCVLPLIPAYLCFLGGTSLERLTAEEGVSAALSRQVMLASTFFVLGFSTVFIAMGATATTLSQAIAQNFGVLSKIAGVIIVLFGFHYAGLLRIGFLNFEKRVHLQNRPAGLAGSYVLGLAFAFGWTPCVGPILATVLMVAATGESIWKGVSLLSFYAAGIGLPFLIAAFAVRPFMAFMRRFRRHMRAVELTIGFLLIGTGVLIFTGGLADIGQWMLEHIPVFSTVG
ncbi:MAG: cytochrome c biogenesis protein CcdA [Proteobacteria bacterium]|nr:MAG: cytochrome c biogenesis protein CcdA [Pseudomonadota bacterium]QKK10783.1 MAG: cytochrome c biogenesis protein CcdA [Pseudomonadota bacterium]